MKVVTVIGTRPDIIKAALRRPLFEDAGIHEVLVHTGQHFDQEMSGNIFEDLGIPTPDYHFANGQGDHIARMAHLLPFMGDVLTQERPNVTYVYGDVDSTLTAALASVRLQIPVAHAEAGVRTDSRYNPEEINRRLSDHVSELNFPVTKSCSDALLREGMPAHQVLMTGDPTLDMLQFATERFDIPIERGDYVLVTIHRAENADSPERLAAIIHGLIASGAHILFPVHPRTRQRLEGTDLWRILEEARPQVELLPALGYVDFLRRLAGANKVVTDSGTVRREAYLLGKPVITPVEINWWPEIEWAGWNRVVGPHACRIAEAIRCFEPTSERPAYFGDGHAEERIVGGLAARFG